MIDSSLDHGVNVEDSRSGNGEEGSNGSSSDAMEEVCSVRLV